MNTKQIKEKVASARKRLDSPHVGATGLRNALLDVLDVLETIVFDAEMAELEDSATEET